MTSLIGRVPGVPETQLSEELLSELPDTVAPAPWLGKARAMFWWKRLDAAGREAATAALPAELGSDLRVTTGVGALISYAETPVGQYHEVIGILVARRGLRTILHVPFIAVDSRASIVGGRANWALPKTLANFTGEPVNGVEMTASGPGWRTSATPTGIGPAIPFAAPALANVIQVGPEGDRWSTFCSGHGRARMARVQASIDEASFGGWFPTGRCWGMLSTIVGNFRAPKRS